MLSSWRCDPGKVFLAVGLVAGMATALLTPPRRGADEPAHLYRAYQVSEGALLAERTGAGVGGHLPRSLKESWRPTYSERSPGLLDRIRARLVPLRPGDRMFVDFRNTALYSPMPYLPQALTIGVGRVLGLPPIFLLYLGRFAGLAAALGLLFAAIRVAPIAKHVLVLLALTPMAVRQIGLLTADTVTNAAAFLLIAMFLRVSLDPGARLRGRFLVLLTLCSLVVSLSKQAYFPLLFLYFLCPVDRAGGRQRYLAIFFGLAALNAAAVAGWFWAIRSLYLPQRIAPAADPLRQLGFIAGHPVGYLRILMGDLRHNGLDYAAQCLGYTGRPPRALAWIYAAALVGVALVDGRRDVAVPFKSKAVLLAVLLCGVAAVNTLNYLGWSSVGGGRISFIQGRYYIPLTPLPLLLLSNRRFGSALPPRRLSFLVGAFAVVASLVTVRFLLLRWHGV